MAFQSRRQSSPRNGLIVILDISRMQRILEASKKSINLKDVLWYKLRKENCVVTNEVDCDSNRMLGSLGANIIGRKGGHFIRLPKGIYSVDKINIRGHSAIFECTRY